MTLAELTVAVSLMAIIMALVLPILTGMRNSADAAHNNMDVTQKVNALNRHLYQHLVLWSIENFSDLLDY